MTFWTFLDRCLERLPGWPSERASVTLLLALLIGSMLKMAEANPGLWDVEVYKVIIQAAVLTGALNMVLAFHFAANKNDEEKTSNTAKAFEAITETAKANNSKDAATTGADEVAEAAGDKADEIARRTQP